MKHKIFILIGCLTWIASFFSEEANLQPYSTIGMLISPIITIVGIILWFKYYKNTRGYYPKFFSKLGEIQEKMRKNPFAGIGFQFTYILEFWTFIILFWMGLVFIGYLSFGQSAAFKASKLYCETNKELIDKTGKIKYYGILMSASISTSGQSGSSTFSFTVIAEKGIFSGESELIKSDNKWIVQNLTLKQKDYSR